MHQTQRSLSHGASGLQSAAPIAFNKPLVLGPELDYIRQAIESGNTQGDGTFTERCCRLLESRYGLGQALLVPSCTSALDLAALLCEIGPGDEVILPPFTFVSTANAFLRLGARLVFVDICPDTYNLDESKIARAITSRTRVIVPVHYAGVACEMDAIMDLAERHRLMVVEDAAQGLDASYRGRWLGSIAPLSTYSFHEAKNVVCGQGGALGINRPELVERAEILRDKGTNRRQFFRGMVARYEWVDVGGSHALSEINAAYLWAQLERVEEITARREALDRRYRELLGGLEAVGRLRLWHAPDHCRSNYHIFYLVLPNQAMRDALVAHLRDCGISAPFHYTPLHTAPMGQKLGYRPGDLPVTEEYTARLIRLPMYIGLTDEEQVRVAEQVAAFFDAR